MKHMVKNSMALLLVLTLIVGVFCLPGFADEAFMPQICADYYAWRCQRDESFSAYHTNADITIAESYGTYDGGTVVLMNVANMQMTDDMLTLEIGGHLFEFNSGARLDMFLVWNSGSFTRVKEAYQKGQLTKADVDKVWALFCQLHPQKEPSFADVAKDAWYREFVDVCAFYQWMYGYEDGKFHPEDNMTRAMFVSVLYRMDNDEEFLAHKDEYERPFDDVPKDAWYADAALWAGVNDIVSGTSAGVFSPNAPLTREQAAAIFARYANKRLKLWTNVQGTVTFPDQAKISDWALAAMQWLKQTGILSGDEQGNANPKGKLSRAQCATLLFQLSDYADLAKSLPAPAVRELTEGFTRSVDGSTIEKPTKADRVALLRFCAELAKRTLTDEQSDVLSPVSALYAIGMTANGAKSETLSQLETAFGIPTERLNDFLFYYSKMLGSGATYKVSLADSIWINEQNSFTVNPAYMQALVDYYRAQAFYGKFDPALCDALNTWVKEKTYDMIPKLLDEINPDAALYLVNTLALQLGWAEPYETAVDGEFTTEGGTVQSCQMLYGLESSYIEDDTTTGFFKRYNNWFSFVALLPDEGVSMEDYLASLSGEKLAALLDGAEEGCIVHTCMPEFTTDSSFELKDALQAMGVVHLFDENNADLTGMGYPLYVSKILQKAHIALDKNGTSAAAATIVEVEAATAAPGEQPKEYEVYLNRPFVYMIVDYQSQLPLFIGVVNSVG